MKIKSCFEHETPCVGLNNNMRLYSSYVSKMRHYFHSSPLPYVYADTTIFVKFVIGYGYSLCSPEILEMAGALTHDLFMTISFSSRGRSSRTAPNCLTEINRVSQCILD